MFEKKIIITSNVRNATIVNKSCLILIYEIMFCRTFINKRKGKFLKKKKLIFSESQHDSYLIILVPTPQVKIYYSDCRIISRIYTGKRGSLVRYIRRYALYSGILTRKTSACKVYNRFREYIYMVYILIQLGNTEGETPFRSKRDRERRPKADGYQSRI